MSDQSPCQLCNRPCGKMLLYIRWFGHGRFDQCITADFRFSKMASLPGSIRVGAATSGDRIKLKVSLVDMETGFVLRDDFKCPLPGWLKEPLKRAIIKADPSQMPPLYKKVGVKMVPVTP